MNQFFKNASRALLPRKAKTHRILSGSLKGRRLVTSWHDYPAAIFGYAEKSLINWLMANVHEEETWMDVGAHYGYTSLAMCERVGRRGKVYAFEPLLATASCLQRTRAINMYEHWTILPFGLSDSPNLSIEPGNTVRGMIDPQVPEKHQDGKTEIVTISFDRIWKEIAHPASQIHGVKIDVQGSEIKVLSGMKETLLKWRPKLVIELHSGVSRSEVLRILMECGYSPNPIPIESEKAIDFFNIDSNYSFLFTA